MELLLVELLLRSNLMSLLLPLLLLLLDYGLKMDLYTINVSMMDLPTKMELLLVLLILPVLLEDSYKPLIKVEVTIPKLLNLKDLSLLMMDLTIIITTTTTNLVKNLMMMTTPF